MSKRLGHEFATTSQQDMKRTKTLDKEENQEESNNLPLLTKIILDDCLVGNEFMFRGLKRMISFHPRRIKLVLLGDSKVGKSSFVSRFEFVKVQTVQLDEHVFTSITTIQFVNPLLYLDIWELYSDVVDSENIIVPQDTLSGLLLGDGCPFLKDSDCAIIMFDVNSRMSYRNVPSWWKLAISNHKLWGVPIALCGTNADSEHRKVKPRTINFHRKKNLPYFDVSSFVNHNVLESVEWLIRKVLKMDTLKLEPCHKLKQFNREEYDHQLHMIDVWEKEIHERFAKN